MSVKASRSRPSRRSHRPPTGVANTNPTAYRCESKLLSKKQHPSTSNESRVRRLRSRITRLRPLASAGVLFTIVSALAPTDAQADAREDFGKAQELYEEGKFASALALFKSVYQETVSPNRPVSTSRAVCASWVTWSRPTRKWRQWRRRSALRAETEPKYKGTRDAAAAELAQLRRRIGRVTIAVEDEPEGMEIVMAGKAVDPQRLGGGNRGQAGDDRAHCNGPRLHDDREDPRGRGRRRGNRGSFLPS